MDIKTSSNLKKLISFVLATLMVLGLAFTLNTNAHADEAESEFQEMKDEKEKKEEDTTSSREEKEDIQDKKIEGETTATEGKSVATRGTRANITVDLADATNYGTEAQRVFTGNHTITLKHTGASLDWAASGKLEHGLILNNFTGTVILDGLNFNTAANKSAIMLLGSSNATIKIKGTNRLSTNKGGVASAVAAIETYNGTKLTITDNGGGSAVDKLYVQATNSTEESAGSVGNGAAIGMSNRPSTLPEVVAGISIPPYPLAYDGAGLVSSAWGAAAQVKSTIIIKGGYVDAQAGWHGAGIGGGHQHHYIGDIVIAGKDTVVESRGGSHGAGIGGGCYNNGNVVKGSVVVVDGAKASATSTSAKGSLGAVGNFLFFTDKADTTLNQQLVSKINIRTEDNQANTKLYLDLGAVPAEVKTALASAGISGAALNKVYFGSTDSTGIATKYGYLTSKVNVVLDDDLRTTKGYEYLPAQVGPATDTGKQQPVVDAVINVPKHAFATNAGNNITIDYGYDAAEAGTNSQVFTITNTANPLGSYEFAKIPSLKLELTGPDADKLEIIPVSGTLPTELPMDGQVQVKIVPKIPTGGAYPVGTYNAVLKASSMHDEDANTSGVQNTIPEIEKAFTLKINKRNITDGNNNFIKIEADPVTGSKRNLASHDVKLTVTNLTHENITKQEYRVIKNGAVVHQWTDFTNKLDVTSLFEEIWGVDPSYKIEVNAISDNVDVKTGFNYNVDMEKPKVSTITHSPQGLQTLGVIDKDENLFTLTFSEAIDFSSFNLSYFIVLDKFTVTTPPTSTGSTTVKFGIKVDQSKIQSGDTVELKIKENIVNDLFDNPSLSSDQSGTTGNTGLIYNSGEPFAIVNELSPSLTNPTLFKTYVKELTINITSNDDLGTGIIYSDTGATNPVTASTNFANFLEIKDKSGNVAYTVTNVTAIPGGKGQKVTIAFAGNGLDTNDYTLDIKAGAFYNAQGKEVEARAYKFTIRIPKMDTTANDTAVIDKIYFDQKGGTATVSVKGEELTYADSFVLKDTTGQIADITQKATNDTNITFTVNFPENIDYNTIENYIFTVDMNNATHTPPVQTAVVTQQGNESAGQTTVVVDRAKSIVEFDLSGGQSSVQTIIADKDSGNKSGKFDFSDFEYGKTNTPTKKDHMFIGWTLNGNRIHDALDLTGAGQGGKYTLVAKWLNIATVIDGNDDDSNGANVEVAKPEEDTAKYPDEATVEDIEKELGGVIVITPDPSDPTTTITLKPEFVWDNNNVSEPGIKEITVFIKNPQTGEMVEQPGKLYIYITAKAYISSRDMVFFELDEPTNGYGLEWSAIVIEEVPDYTNKTIVKKLHPTKLVFDPNGFTTRSDGDYTVKFNAAINTYRGHEFVVPEKLAAGKVFPFNVENYNAAVERQSAGNEMDFWRVVSEKIHTSSKSSSYGVDKNNYKFGGDTPRNLTAKSTNYDREIVAGANEFPMMSSQVFEELTLKENNTKLTVNYGNIIWEFYSQDFKKLPTNPTGFFNLKYKEGNENKNITNLLGNREQQQIAFEMNNSFISSGTLTVKLSKALSEKSNLNLFYFNESTGKLELIGAMVKNQNNSVSIKMKEVRGTYVIVSGLSTSASSSTTGVKATNNSTTTVNNKDKVLSYRITELTDLSDEKFVKEVEKDLESSGQTIKSISVLDADEKTLSNIDNQKYAPFVEKNSSIMVAVLSATAVLLIGALVYFVLVKKKEEKTTKEDIA